MIDNYLSLALDAIEKCRQISSCQPLRAPSSLSANEAQSLAKLVFSKIRLLSLLAEFSQFHQSTIV